MKPTFRAVVFGDNRAAIEAAAIEQATAFYGPGFTYKIITCDVRANAGLPSDFDTLRRSIQAYALEEAMRGAYRASITVEAEPEDEADPGLDEAGIYAARVLNTLEEVLPGKVFSAPTLAAAIERHHKAPRPEFEAIVDEPFTARWKLLADARRPGEVLLVCANLHLSPRDTRALDGFKQIMRNGQDR